MKILVDVVHPAHVHFFRHALERWREKGDEVLVTARRKDVTLDLLGQMGIGAHVLSTAGRGLGGLLWEKSGPAPAADSSKAVMHAVTTNARCFIQSSGCRK